MDADRKKELKSAYMNREVIGGIYCIECSGDKRKWILWSADLKSAKNRFDFAVSLKSCLDPSMRNSWEKYGTDSFSYTVIEELKKSKDQTDKEFRDDVKALYDIWMENNKD